ncbi:hypothetical protein [Bacillus pseudomycoides]|uniref:hypothetical protein n=1 Tax=Bacillus pseudomycoides TaxID=64104 RepID=UPI001FB40A80|nr:hypothetical protein [Bacillus pseudomycoides]
MKTFTTPQEILKKFTYKISETKEIIPLVIKLLSIFYKQENSYINVSVEQDGKILEESGIILVFLEEWKPVTYTKEITHTT